MLGGNVSVENQATYAWDNLVSLSIQNYVLKLSRAELHKIFKEMQAPNAESRIVYYYRIYVPALEHLENRSHMVEMLKNYLESLPDQRRQALLLECDRTRKSKHAYKVLHDRLYLPALKHFKSTHRNTGARQGKAQASPTRLKTR